MPTTGGPPTGRERRRKGPINRIRRFLYGLLLLAAAPGAAAVDELAAYGRYRIAPAAAADAEQRVLATVQGLIVLRSEPGQDGMPQVELDTVTARIQGDRTEPAPQSLVAANKVGNGYDVALSDAGALRLDLRIGAIENSPTWSLDGTLAHHGPEGRKDQHKVADVPKVRIHAMHTRETRYLPFEISVRESQLGFKWRV